MLIGREMVGERGSNGGMRRLLPRSFGLPRYSGRSASASSLSSPVWTSLTLRPAGSLNHPRRPLSRGFGRFNCTNLPLVSYQINRLLSERNLPPLVIRAVGAHLINLTQIQKGATCVYNATGSRSVGERGCARHTGAARKAPFERTCRRDLSMVPFFWSCFLILRATCLRCERKAKLATAPFRASKARTTLSCSAHESTIMSSWTSARKRSRSMCRHRIACSSISVEL